jgi:DNA-directed RNA polymerase specialized sigma24 family protein
VENVSAEGSDDSARPPRAPISSEVPTDRLMTKEVVDRLEELDDDAAAANELLDGIAEPIRSTSCVEWLWLGDDDDEEVDERAEDEALVVDPLDDEERWRRQLVLYERARADGFEGPWFQAWATTVVEYAEGVLDGWIVSELIWVRVRWPVKRTSTEQRLLEADQQTRMELINDVALAALENWIEAEQNDKGWNPGGGASLNSWFVTGCLYTFPNEFGKWQTKQRWRREEHVAADLGAEVSDIEAELVSEHRRSRKMFPSPESRAVLTEQLELALAMLDNDEERAIVKLKALGYPIKEIAEVVGKPPAEIKNFLKRLKRRDISSQMEGKQDE